MSTEITTEPADRDARVKDVQGFAWKRAAAGDEPCSNCWTTELGGAHRSWRGLLKERGPLTLVEAAWTIGQKVSGGDYARLPIGSVVFEEPAAEDTVESVPIMKTGEDEWTNQGWPGVFASATLSYDVRTLTRLGDGVADVEIVEPRACRVCGCTENDCSGCIERTGHPCSWVESDLCSACADAAHLEPEPLKEGDWVQVWAQVRDPEPDYDGEIQLRLDRLGAKTEDRFADAWARPDAIVRPADGAIPPWVKEPEPEQCASLKSRVNGSFVRCDLDEHDASTDHGNNAFGTSWTNAEAYGRVEVSS